MAEGRRTSSFISLHKCIKNTSTDGKVLTERAPAEGYLKTLDTGEYKKDP